MLKCDRCQVEYPDDDVLLNDEGEFRCVHCLGLRTQNVKYGEIAANEPKAKAS